MNRLLGFLELIGAQVLRAVCAWWLWGIFAVCVLSSFAAVAASHRGFIDNVDRFSVEIQERMRLQLNALVGPGGRQMDRSLRVLRPPSPTSVVIAGVERTMPSGWDFGPAGVEATAPYPSQDPLAIFDLLSDAESVIRVFGGLLALFLGFWMVTRDRQRGWLVAPTSFPVAAWQLSTAILVAGGLVLAFLSLVWMTAVVTLAQFLLGPQHDIGLAFWSTSVVVWGYLITMFGIGAAIAQFAGNPLAGTASAVFTWTVLILLGPQIFSTLARLATDLPPRVQMEHERREAYADRQRTADRTLAEQLAASAAPSASKFELDRAATEALPLHEPEWRSQMRAARTEADETLLTWLESRRRWLDWLAFVARLTPGTLLHSSLAEINGQGWAVATVWEDAVVRHERSLNQALFDDRGALNLRLPWNNTAIPWGHIWHDVRPHSQLPQFEDSTVQLRAGRGASWKDLIATMIQVIVVLGVAAAGPRRFRHGPRR